jgi:ABC-2 type transport system permease protein
MNALAHVGGGADFSIVWPLLAAIAAIGSVHFAFALHRFRRVIFGA